MDKKTKKQLVVLWDRRQQRKKLRAGAKQQCAELGENGELERHISQAQDDPVSSERMREMSD